MKKKLISVLLLAGLLWGTFVGSHREISEEIVVPQELFTYSGQKETIYFWYTNEELVNYISNAAVTFGKEENVRVIPILKESGNLLDEINKASFSSAEKQFPDMYIIDNESLELAYLSGLAAQVSDEKQILNERYFAKTALDAVTYHNKLVGYPFYYETSTLLYNKTYLDLWMEQQLNISQEEEEPLEESASTAVEGELIDQEDTTIINKDEVLTQDGLPITVDGILYVANSFEAPAEVEGVMKWAVSDIFYNYWFVGNYLVVGGDTGDDKENIHVNNEEIKSCLSVYQSLNRFFSIESDTVNSSSVVQDFMDGKLVYTIVSTKVVDKLAQAKKDGQISFEYGFCPLPDINTELKSRALSVTNAVVVNGYSDHQEIANKFAAYLTNTMADELYARTGVVSSNKLVNQENPALSVFYEEYSNSVSLPKMMEIGNLWLQLERLFSKVWNSEEITPLLEQLSKQLASQLEIS